MIKYFCDQCGGEITPADSRKRNTLGRLVSSSTRGGVKLTVEIIQMKDGVSNDGHFCRYCVIDAINQLDDRPRAG